MGDEKVGVRGCTAGGSVRPKCVPVVTTGNSATTVRRRVSAASTTNLAPPEATGAVEGRAAAASRGLR